jgi:Hint domain
MITTIWNFHRRLSYWNAMADTNAATQLSITTPTRTIREILRSFGRDCSGDVLYKKVIQDVKEIFGFRRELTGTACFMAGTLIHTKEGLVPIERIKVGDWVLSQPEEKGELDYKRVVRTMEFEDWPVWRVSFQKRSEIYDSADVGVLIVTANHPFWVSGYDLEIYPEEEWGPLGWTRADSLVYGSLLELANGDLVRVLDSERLWRTQSEGIAWTEVSNEAIDGYTVDLRNGRFNTAVDYVPPVMSDFSDDDGFMLRNECEESQDVWSYKCSVYNFEVEDFHTYYVGEFGVWVRDLIYQN